MHYGDVPTLDLENNNVSHSHWLLLVVGEEEEVAAVEGWLHATTGVHNLFFINTSERLEPYYFRSRSVFSHSGRIYHICFLPALH